MIDTDHTGPVQTEVSANIDGEPAFVMEWEAPEHMADLGGVPLSRYAFARFTLEKHKNRVRVVIATAARHDAPEDARPLAKSRPLAIRADHIPLMIARLQAAHDHAVRAGMSRKGGIA